MTRLESYEFPFARYPGVRNALLLMVGIILSGTCGLSVGLTPLVFLVTTYWTILVYERWVVTVWMVYVLNGITLLTMVVLGMTLWAQHTNRTDEVRVLYDGLAGTEVLLSGVVLAVTDGRGGIRSIEIDTDSLMIHSRIRWESRVQMRANAGQVRGMSEIRMGDRVWVRMQISAYPMRRNPGGFDVAAWLVSRGIQGTGTVTEVLSYTPDSNRLRWVWWRARVHEKIESTVRDPYQSLLKAILLGDKSGLEAEVKTEFSRAGLSHVMAVSGMHVGFVLLPIWLIIPLFWSGKVGRPFGLLIIVGILLGYAGLTGFSSSVSRASITASLLAFGKLFQQNRDSVNTTGVAALIIILANPESMFQIGFQLSFSAVMVILVLGPVMQELIPRAVRYTWTGNVIQFMGISTIVQFGLFPLLAATFGEFSLAGPLANMLGVPFTQGLFLWSMFALPLSFMVPYVDRWVMIPAEWMAAGLLGVAEFVGGQDWAWVTITTLPGLLSGMWLALVGLLGSVFIPELRWKWLIVVLVAMLASGVHGFLTRLEVAELEVRVLDVGQGDATLIRCPSGKSILIDTGRWSPGYNSGTSVIIPELKALGIGRVDAVVLSHPHGDHVGGMLALLEQFEVGAIYQSDFEYGSGLFRGYMLAAERVGVPVLTVERGDVVGVCSEAPLLVMHPGDGSYGSDPNAWSVVVKLVYGETSFLFTGDAEEIAERELVNHYGVALQSDWLKAGHHGSKTSSTIEFLRSVQPEMITVSLAYRNRYQHPHEVATVRLGSITPDIKYTSLDRGLVYKSDGQKIRESIW
jgi:competence protein ComEC